MPRTRTYRYLLDATVNLDALTGPPIVRMGGLLLDAHLQEWARSQRELRWLVDLRVVGGAEKQPALRLARGCTPQSSSDSADSDFAALNRVKLGDRKRSARGREPAKRP